MSKKKNKKIFQLLRHHHFVASKGKFNIVSSIQLPKKYGSARVSTVVKLSQSEYQKLLNSRRKKNKKKG